MAPMKISPVLPSLVESDSTKICEYGVGQSSKVKYSKWKCARKTTPNLKYAEVYSIFLYRAASIKEIFTNLVIGWSYFELDSVDIYQQL